MGRKDNDNRSDNRGGDDDKAAFALFCAYHLGLDPNGNKRAMNIHDVARALRCSVDDVASDLERFGLTSDRLLNLDFDLAAAREDIWASPPGVDLASIAVMHFEFLQQAEERPRDWEAERRADEEENERVFGKK